MKNNSLWAQYNVQCVQHRLTACYALNLCQNVKLKHRKKVHQNKNCNICQQLHDDCPPPPIYLLNCYVINVILISVECNDGLFGDMCQKECGRCLNMSQCHHINGICINGCKPGYSSEFCNQCKYFALYFLLAIKHI